MATQVCEKLAMINCDNEFEGMEFSEITGSLLFSLMEELPQGSENDDDDRLDNLIRSLEAEISGTTMNVSDELASHGSQDGQPWSIVEVDDQDYWASSCDFELEYVNMDVLPSSPWNGRSWGIDSYGGEMDGISDILYANNLKMDDGFAMGNGDQACNWFLEREL